MKYIVLVIVVLIFCAGCEDLFTENDIGSPPTSIIYHGPITQFICSYELGYGDSCYSVYFETPENCYNYVVEGIEAPCPFAKNKIYTVAIKEHTMKVTPE